MPNVLCMKVIQTRHHILLEVKKVCEIRIKHKKFRKLWMKKPLDINARGFFIYTYQSKKNCLVIIALHQGWNPFQVHQVSTHNALWGNQPVAKRKIRIDINKDTQKGIGSDFE